MLAVPVSGGFSGNTTCIRFTCSVFMHCNQIIMDFVLFLHNGTLKNVLQIPFFLLKCCFLIRHSLQGKDFSTRIAPICGRRRTCNRTSCRTDSIFGQCLGRYFRKPPHRTLPVAVSSNQTQLLALFAVSFATTFGRRTDFCIDATDNVIQYDGAFSHYS